MTQLRQAVLMMALGAGIMVAYVLSELLSGVSRLDAAVFVILANIWVAGGAVAGIVAGEQR
jgi:hypothetical protein